MTNTLFASFVKSFILKTCFGELSKTNFSNKYFAVFLELIHIFEDDFDKYLSYFKHEILRICNKLPKPLLTNVCKISIAKRESFILVYGNDTNYENSDLCYGAFRNDELVSVMSFKKSRENVYELSSFVQKHCYDARFNERANIVLCK